MKLFQLTDLALFAAEINPSVTNSECEDIRDFAKTWHDLLDLQLEDLHLSRLNLDEQDRDYLSIGGTKI